MFLKGEMSTELFDQINAQLADFQEHAVRTVLVGIQQALAARFRTVLETQTTGYISGFRDAQETIDRLARHLSESAKTDEDA